MPEIELDDEKEGVSKSKDTTNHSSTSSSLKTTAAPSFLARDKLQKQVASGQLIYKPPIVEKVKELVATGIRVINEKPTNDLDTQNPKTKSLDTNIKEAKEPDHFLGLNQLSNPTKLGLNILGNICDSFVRIRNYSMNMASECQDVCMNLLTDINSLYTETKGFFSNIYKKCVSSLTKLYNRLKESLVDSVKFVGRLFDSKDTKASPREMEEYSELPKLKFNEIKIVHPEQIQTVHSNITKDYEHDEPLILKLKSIVENLAQVFIQKEKDKKLENEQYVIQHQVKLSQEADRAFSEALLKRPDLASKLSRPQIAFLSSSPFAKIPSADDLIEQAEKTPTIH